MNLMYIQIFFTRSNLKINKIEKYIKFPLLYLCCKMIKINIIMIQIFLFHNFEGDERVIKIQLLKYYTIES